MKKDTPVVLAVATYSSREDVVVAVNKKGSDISPLLLHANQSIVDDSTTADLEAVYDDAIAKATS